MARPYRSQQVLQRSTPTGALPWSSQLRPRIVSCTAPPSASPTDTPTAAVFLAGFIALTAARRLRASSVSRALLVWCSRWSKHLRRSQVLTVTLSRYLSRHVTVKNAFWLWLGFRPAGGSGFGFDRPGGPYRVESFAWLLCFVSGLASAWLPCSTVALAPLA